MKEKNKKIENKMENIENTLKIEPNSYLGLITKKFHKYQRKVYNDNQLINTYNFFLEQEAHDTFQNCMRHAYKNDEILYLGEMSSKEYLSEFLKEHVSHTELVKIPVDKINKIVNDIKTLPENISEYKIDLGL